MKSVWRVAVCALALQQMAWADEAQISTVTEAATKTESVATPAIQALPLTDLRTFVDVFERIRNSYVDPVDDKTLFENAIKGMLSALDPHSAYLDKNDYQDLKAQTTGEFGGIGVEIGMDDGYLRVISPIDDTPASKAGVLAGDYIVKLDDKPVKGMTMNEAVDIMRGAIGVPLKLTIQRKGEEAKDLVLIRSKIEVSSVKTRQINPEYAVIRISQFQTHTGRDLTTALNKLKESQPKLKGLILDLRNNPGGILGSAISVTDAFIDKGLVVYTKARTDESIDKFEATEGQVIPNIPLLVLVNGGSASASEIVAGALQDHHRAIIAGTTTFGKGSVQTVLPISEDKGIKLTTARYYTPNGRSIQAEGIKPDVVIEAAKLEISKVTDSYKEADLKGHLINPNDKADATNTFVPAVDNTSSKPEVTPKAEPANITPSKKLNKKSKAKSDNTVGEKSAADAVEMSKTAAKTEMPSEKTLAEDDYVLYAALNVLKGATFWQTK